MSGVEYRNFSPETNQYYSNDSTSNYENIDENFIEDYDITNLNENEQRHTNKSKTTQQKARVTLLNFLRLELTRGYLLENDQIRFSARREKIYSFMKIPREVEKFMAYGFFQCADSFMYVYTFLPMRYLLAIWNIITRPLLWCFGYKLASGRSILTPAEKCDLIKGSMLLVCTFLMFYIDTNMMYHLIKTFGQDTIDALLWTATEPRGRKREHFGILPHLLFALTYVFLHSLLVLFQATTLNVAINASNKSLLTIMMSNNFVELKGSVFKKFDKNNLFQLSCSDVRERFHLFVLLFIVLLQTLKEYSWREDRFWVLLPDCVMVLLAEVLVDWIKHAFITRFNEIPVDIYTAYITSLAYDTALTRKKTAFSDHSDVVARRMGFIPLPLGVVMIRVLGAAVHIEGTTSVILVIIAYFVVISFRTLNSLVILGKGCALMKEHKILTDPILKRAERIRRSRSLLVPPKPTRTCSDLTVSYNDLTRVQPKSKTFADKDTQHDVSTEDTVTLESIRMTERLLEVSDHFADDTITKISDSFDQLNHNSNTAQCSHTGIDSF